MGATLELLANLLVRLLRVARYAYLLRVPMVMPSSYLSFRLQLYFRILHCVSFFKIYSCWMAAPNVALAHVLVYHGSVSTGLEYLADRPDRVT